MSCAYGVQNVGYVLIVYGVCDAICSFSFGYVIKLVGRVPIFIFGAIINAIVIVILFTWAPNPEEAYVFYILSGLWGVADAVWQTQINGEFSPLSRRLLLLLPSRLHHSTLLILPLLRQAVCLSVSESWHSILVMGFLSCPPLQCTTIHLFLDAKGVFVVTN